MLAKVVIGKKHLMGITILAVLEKLEREVIKILI
jgi:hypothetical protein